MNSSSAATDSPHVHVSNPAKAPGTNRRRLVAGAAGYAVGFVGIVVAYGWIAGIPALVRLHPAFVSMKFNTAAGFMAFGLGTLLLLHEWRRAALLCALVLVSLGLATGLEYAFGTALGIDDLLVKPFLVEANVPAGRMSPVTALLFALSGIGLALSCRRNRPRTDLVIGVLAAVIGGIAISALVGYATRMPVAYGWGAVASVAVHTAATFLLVAVALATFATEPTEPYPPRWLPTGVFIAGFACTLALGIALYAEIDPDSHSLAPEVALLIGTALSASTALALHSRRLLKVQRDLLVDASSKREEALSERAQLAAIVESSNEAIIALNLHGEVVVWNQGSEQLYGYSAAEMLGQRVRRIIPADYLEDSVTAVANAREGRSTRDLRTVRLHKSGRRIDVEVDVCPLRDASGRIVGSSGIGRDITERIEAERLIRGVLEAAPDAMVIADADGRVVLVNSMTEQLFGYTRHELIGISVEQLLPSRYRAGHVAHRRAFSAAPARRAMAGGRELQAMRRDGSELPVDVALNALDLPNRTLVVAAVRDATARRRAKQELRDSLAEKELLLKELHHRVKNNLQVVASLLTLQAEQAREPYVQELLERCRQRVLSMALVHEKLYGASDLRRIDLGDLVREIATMLVGNDPGAAIRLSFDIEPVTVDIESAFPASLIVNELITNAVKHAYIGRDHGYLQVSVHRVSVGRIRIEVTDDGPGTLTLEAFHKAESLGSSIVLNLIRQLDGELSVGPGPGAKVALSFPFSGDTIA